MVVNSSGSIRSNAVPLPWGGDGPSVTLSPGLNALLIPREQFLDSPFGEAIFLGRNMSYNTSSGAPPLVGSSEAHYLVPFGGANLMVDLGAHWQNRAIELPHPRAEEGRAWSRGPKARAGASLVWSDCNDLPTGRGEGRSALPCNRRHGVGGSRPSDLR